VVIKPYIADDLPAHAAPESVTNQCPLIDDCLSLKILVPRKGKRFPYAVERIGRLLLLLDSLACRAHDSVGLVAEVGGELAMRSHHFGGRMNLLLIPRRVRGSRRADNGRAQDDRPPQECLMLRNGLRAFNQTHGQGLWIHGDT
jgi:hypothetical protein